MLDCKELSPHTLRILFIIDDLSLNKLLSKLLFDDLSLSGNPQYF